MLYEHSISSYGSNHFASVTRWCFTVVLTFAMSIASAIGTARIDGDWSGKLKIGTAVLPLVFHLNTAKDGVLSGTLDSPLQGATGIKLTSVSVKGDEVTILIDSIKAEFVGHVEPGNIVGKFKQRGAEFDLVLQRETAVSLFSPKPQTPVGPFPYDVREVKFVNQESGIVIAGTLTVPLDNKANLAIVLIPGSGPLDRNESIGSHEPFKLLADFFTRNGFPVLRCDKRGIGQSGGDYANATALDFASDVHAAMTYLQTEHGLSRIALVGHSEGASVAAMVARKFSEPEYVVLLAPPGMPGALLLPLQLDRLLRMNGQSISPEMASALDIDKRIFEVAAGGIGENIEAEITDLLKKKRAT